jgi:putative ABC transport system permease protein
VFRNYLKTAIRNILRQKGFALINIASLSIGIVGCMLIGLFVWDEWKFDRDIAGGDQVYRIYSEWHKKGEISNVAPIPPAVGSFLREQYPEVETSARILMLNGKFLLESGEKKAYEDKGMFVESTFFRVFPLKFENGDPATALADSGSVVLTHDLASRYFGRENPVGKTIKIDKSDYAIKGVLAPLPSHFHLDFQYLMSLSSAGLPKERMEKWSWHQFFTYVRLKPGTNVQGLESKFRTYVKKNIDPQQEQGGIIFIPHFQKLKDIHLHSADFVYDNAVRGNGTYVRALTIIAIFVLLIACFNFINLATARSFRRAKEIGVRKVVGAARIQLIMQFLGETLLLSVISVILATILTWLIVPALNNFTGKSIYFNPVFQPLTGLLILAGGAIVGILAGLYPALILSGFKPIRVLKNSITEKGIKLSWLRQSLVVIQFAMSALLIVSALMVYRQTRFMNDKDLGFNKDQVIAFEVREGIDKNLETFKNELRQYPQIVSVTSGYGLPGDQFAGDAVKIPGKDGDKQFPVSLFIGDQDYIKTLGIQIIAGRDFSRDMATDTDEAFIINETAVREMGFGTPEKALGQRINWDKWVPDSLHPVKQGKVIGVVKDFHYKSLHEKVAPSVIQMFPQVTYKIAVKLRSKDARNTIAFIQDTWNKFCKTYPMDYQFLDDSFGKMYKSEEKLASLLWVFTIMAIIVGCMGLFGLAALNTEQRTKEIGIRKVLGASMLDIVGQLSKNFVKLVLIACVIAFPFALWAMQKWLENFPYRVSLNWTVFAVALLASLLIAFITISFQSVKAATANPVKSLRNE